MHHFARFNWEQTPSNLGLDDAVIERIKTLQVFGIQADEMWSLVQKKIEKRWIWIAYDPVHRLVVAFYIGKRDKIAAKEFAKEFGKKSPLHYEAITLKRTIGKLMKVLSLPINIKWERI